MACRDYVSVEPMTDCETLYSYSNRLTGDWKNAFPDLNTNTRRGYILYVYYSVKDVKVVKCSRKPFATFIGQVGGQI